MTVVYVPLVCALALAVGAPIVARRVSPASGCATLVPVALAVAIAADVALAVLVGARLLDVAPLAAFLHWRAERSATIPVPVPVSIAAGLALVSIAVVADWRRTRAPTRWLRSVRRDRTPGELIVVRSPAVFAHAVPGIRKAPGRIVVSDSMLRALDADERFVLLEHERSHLRHRHDRHRRLIRIAALINPLLRPSVEATDFLVERWADEDAAHAVGSRRLAARALARAAVASVPHLSIPWRGSPRRGCRGASTRCWSPPRRVGVGYHCFSPRRWRPSPGRRPRSPHTIWRISSTCCAATVSCKT